MNCRAFVGGKKGYAQGLECDNPSLGQFANLPLCRYHYSQLSDHFTKDLSKELIDLKWEFEDWKNEARLKIAMEQTTREAQALESRRENTKVYFMKCGEYIKIGSSYNPELRLKNIGSAKFPVGLDINQTKLLGTIPGGQPKERALHKRFAHIRVIGEWFTEAPELVKFIEEIAA